ncbi:MAG: hypothetical protein A3K19_21375 [Lentisphaerae bacterium RIFOXYB12_FULL_65_16]|nr:MAG: hypothetical protein A3K18_34050 [Lentisphaerae bacterium RIFOXYA12_64_32]OGV93683.1 MAG: hypothetical protein A3K19_21375 [Lentisphaerae bacterium RIFOXYB12_FULL_65_16]
MTHLGIRVVRRRASAVLRILTGFALLGVAASGAFLKEGDTGGPSPRPPEPRPPDVRPVEPPIVIVPPRPFPVPGGQLIRLVDAVRVEAPYTHGQLTVFPLSLRNPERHDIRTLDEALRNDWVRIYEKPSAAVPELIGRNESPHYIFLMAGEILQGGRQNRLVRHDLLLPPRSGDVDIPVYCVEKGRWEGKDPIFDRGPGLADHELRMKAAGGASQDAIWSEVRSRSEQFGVKSATEDYQSVFQAPAVRRELSGLVAPFRKLCRPEYVGAVIVADNRIVGCDLFSSSILFRKLWMRICESYAMDVIWRGYSERLTIREEDVRRFLDGVHYAAFTEQGSPGEGTRVEISRNVDGQALFWRDTVVHAVLRPGYDVRPMPVPQPMPGPLYRE